MIHFRMSESFQRNPRAKKFPVFPTRAEPIYLTPHPPPAPVRRRLFPIGVSR